MDNLQMVNYCTAYLFDCSWIVVNKYGHSQFRKITLEVVQSSLYLVIVPLYQIDCIWFLDIL
jgi:hypothetical protein